MEVNTNIAYDVGKSSERIDEIINADSGNYTDKNCIPTRDSLTYTNGFYVKVTALYIDLVGSSDMTDEHKRPTLAKTYRSFISECTAIMSAEPICKEINIVGDCVWGVFETPKKNNINTVFDLSVKLNSFIKILNYKLRKKEYTEISVGIGMDYGRALMVKAGYKGSSINDVIWMGDVVNSASKISGLAGRNREKPIFVSDCIYSNLNEDNKAFLNSTSVDGVTYYSGDILDSMMNKWYKDNCT